VDIAPAVAALPPLDVEPAIDAPPVPPLAFGDERRGEGSSDAQLASKKTLARPALTRWGVDVDAGMGLLTRRFTAAPRWNPSSGSVSWHSVSDRFVAARSSAITSTRMFRCRPRADLKGTAHATS
jgi:hypothetical protein